MRKMYSKKQIEEIAKSSAGGKVYLHNIYLAGYRTGYMKLYTTNNEPFTKSSLTSFMVNNGIVIREKGFPLCYESTISYANNVIKVLNTNFVAYVGNNNLVISSEAVTFNFVDNNVVLAKTSNNNNVNSITDTVIEL